MPAPALEFYRSVFAGDLMTVTYEDAGNVKDPSEAKQVMWGQVTTENGFRVMAYDVPSSRAWSRGEDPFFVSLRGDEAEDIADLWEKLHEGSTVVVSLGPAQCAPLYGMLTDPFGITWVVDVASEYAAS